MSKQTIRAQELRHTLYLDPVESADGYKPSFYVKVAEAYAKLQRMDFINIRAKQLVEPYQFTEEMKQALREACERSCVIMISEHSSETRGANTWIMSQFKGGLWEGKPFHDLTLPVVEGDLAMHRQLFAYFYARM